MGLGLEPGREASVLAAAEGLEPGTGSEPELVAKTLVGVKSIIKLLH